MRKKIIHNKFVAILFFLMIFGFKLYAESILSIKDNYEIGKHNGYYKNGNPKFEEIYDKNSNLE